MPQDSSAIVSKVWNYPPSPSGLRRAGTHVLKNAGVGYGPAWRGIEQITYLLFLKLAPASLSYAVASCEMSELGLDHSQHRSRTLIA